MRQQRENSFHQLTNLHAKLSIRHAQGETRAVFSLANVMEFLPYKFTGVDGDLPSRASRFAREMVEVSGI